MTPVGHAAFSYVVGRGTARWISLSIAGLVVGGVLPDIDFALFWAPQFNAWHRVITHNLLFCAAAAGLAALWGRRRGPAEAVALGLGVGLGALGHLLTDSMMDANASNGLGVAWLWPFSTRVTSPLNLMEWVPVPANPAGWDDPVAALRGALYGVIWELPFWGLAAWWWRGDRASRGS